MKQGVDVTTLMNEDTNQGKNDDMIQVFFYFMDGMVWYITATMSF